MKAVTISTHGFAVFEGTMIACKAFINRNVSEYSFLYNNEGVMIEAKEAAYNPVRDSFIEPPVVSHHEFSEGGQ